MFSRLNKNVEKLTSLCPHKILVVTTILSLLYFCWGINSWRYAMVGDEWQFYQFALDIINKHYWINPLSFNGVYNENSVLSSMYQAFFVDFFNLSNFGWRFSNIILIIPISIFFYKWLREYFETEIALFSTLFLQCSFYLANFFKVAKNMPQALALLTISLYWAVVCVRCPDRKNFFIFGIILGISFYIYIGPLFPFIIWPIFLPLLSKPNRKKIFLNSLYLLPPVILLLLPSLLDLKSLNGPATPTVLHREFKDNMQIIKNVFHTFLLFYKNYEFYYTQFVYGPYLDVVTRSLALCGTVISVLQIHKFKYRVLLLIYINTCVFIGATIPYTSIPTTRGIFFIPFGAAFAGIALYALLSFVRLSVPSQKAVLAVFFCGVFLFNFYISQVRVFEELGFSGSALFFQALQQAKKDNRNSITLVLTPQYNINKYVWMWPSMQKAYGLSKVNYKIIPPDKLQCSDIAKEHIYFFNYDTESVNQFNILQCSPAYHITSTVLSPKITWY